MMNKTRTQSHKRINISLPVETLQLMDRITKKGDRSRFIDQAVRFYVSESQRERLRDLLKEGAKANAGRDLMISEEWFTLEDEACPPNQN